MSDDVKTTSQDDPTIIAKREEARKAMSLGMTNPPKDNPPTPADKPEQTPSTQPKTDEVLSGAKIVSEAENSMRIAEKRLQAQMAMEGEERRRVREEAIRKEREQAEKIRIEEEEKRRKQFEKDKIEQERINQEIRMKEQRERISQELKQQVEEVKGGVGGLKTIRTLRMDQDSLIKGQNLSIIGIAIKEDEKRRQQQENRSLTSGKNRTILVASIVLIILGSGIGFYIYNSYYADTPVGILTNTNTTPDSIIFTESTNTVDTTGITLDDLLDRIKNEVRNPPNLRLGAIENFVFNKRNDAGQITSLNTAEFLKIIGSETPDNLLRTLDREYMFGILSSAENAGFIIIKTESHEKGFAGMLDWERQTLTKDLYQILTSIKPEPELLTKEFEDLLIRNVDTRILRDKNGDIRIVYGFLDGERTIIIAGSRQAFIEAQNRFNTPKPLSR